MKKRRGIGKMRYRIAEMISELFHCECYAEDIWIQNPTYAKWDLARWGVNCRINGALRNVHSWDRMTDIIKAGKMVRVNSNSDEYEVCSLETFSD